MCTCSIRFVCVRGAVSDHCPFPDSSHWRYADTHSNANISNTMANDVIEIVKTIWIMRLCGQSDYSVRICTVFFLSICRTPLAVDGRFSHEGGMPLRILMNMMVRHWCDGILMMITMNHNSIREIRSKSDVNFEWKPPLLFVLDGNLWNLNVLEAGAKFSNHSMIIIIVSNKSFRIKSFVMIYELQNWHMENLSESVC